MMIQQHAILTKAHGRTNGGRSHHGDLNPTDIGGARRTGDPGRAAETKRHVSSGGKGGAVVTSDRGGAVMLED